MSSTNPDREIELQPLYDPSLQGRFAYQQPRRSLPVTGTDDFFLDDNAPVLRQRLQLQNPTEELNPATPAEDDQTARRESMISGLPDVVSGNVRIDIGPTCSIPRPRYTARPIRIICVSILFAATVAGLLWTLKRLLGYLYRQIMRV